MSDSHKSLPNVSSDYLSDVRLVDNTNQLIVTSWDGSVSLYDWLQGHLIVRLKHDCALTCCCFVTLGKRFYVGSVQGELLHVDWESEKLCPIKCVERQLGISCLCSFNGYLVLGSWDGFIQMIDSNNDELKFTMNTNGKIFTMDCSNKNIVCYSTSGIYIFDCEDINRTPIRNESGLKYQTRAICLIPDGTGYLQSSIDGRVAAEYFNDKSRKFAFRCHRMNLKDLQFVFPVNTLCFRPNSDILFTGGSDGHVVIWNLTKRKKIDTLPKYDNSVVKICCNEQVLVIATSDDSLKTNPTIEDIQLQPSKIYIKNL